MFKIVTATLGAITLFVVVGITNDLMGTSTDISKPYVESYSYCASTTYTAKGSYCAHYAMGKETRVNTRVDGMWFDHDSYRVVR